MGQLPADPQISLMPKSLARPGTIEFEDGRMSALPPEDRGSMITWSTMWSGSFECTPSGPA